MTFKLIESAQDRWRAVNAPHLVALVRAGALHLGYEAIPPPDDPGPDHHRHHADPTAHPRTACGCWPARKPLGC
jgi:hypothetical protein